MTSGFLALFLSFFSDPSAVPVSFSYGGRHRSGLDGLEVLERTVAEVQSGKRGTLRVRLDEGVEARLEASWCAEYDETEYTLWFENTGEKPSRVLGDVKALQMSFEGERPRLRGLKGDHWDQYAAYDWDLAKGSPWRLFKSTGGRATHEAFPYFDLVHGDGGTLLAFGWAGTWQAQFAGHAKSTWVEASTCLGLRTALLPGEKVRTGLVVLLPYRGRSANGAANRWRSWFMKYSLPRANAAGEALRPLTTSIFAKDTGRPNSDGSISEGADTWRRTLEKLCAEKVLPDFRWFDAGWYFDPSGKTVEKAWWETVGSWRLDTVKWPDGSFRASNDACHALGMKVLTWFEPERVTHLDDMVRLHGYRREWCVQTAACITSDLGNPDCRAWTLARILAMMDENGVDLYREDNNSDPAEAWRVLDERSAQATGLPRLGISENKGIQGHYALWDAIIAHGAKTGKCTFVDSCAAGGGRNDVESLRRSVPFMRSDFDRTTLPLRLSISWGFNRWIPFHGSSTREAATEHGAQMSARGADRYASRASYLPIFNYSYAFSHNPELDYDLLRANLAEWRSVAPLLVRDFYALTPWHSQDWADGWTVFAYDAPERGESVVLAFRMERATEPTFAARLEFARSGCAYELVDADTGRRQTFSGEVLRDRGFDIALDSPRSSALVRIFRKDGLEELKTGGKGK